MINFLVAHGLELACGLTVILTAGAVATARSRGPVQRHAIARLTFAATWLGLLLLVLPLPRPARIAFGRIVVLRPEAASEAIEEPVVASDRLAPALVPEVSPLPFTAELASEPLDLHAAAVQLQTWGTRAATVDAPDFGALPAEPTAPTIDLGPWIARAFLAVALALALHLLLCAAVLRRTLRRARPLETALADRIDAWCREAGVDARVLVSDDAARPFCCGVRRGTIVLPADLARSQNASGLEAVVRHELAHLVRRDPAARLVAALSAPLLYWNPLYWWLASELRRSAELLADDAAASSIDKRRYVAELLSLAERSASSFPALVPNVLGSRRDFLMRMEALLMRSHRLPSTTSRRHTFSRTVGAALVLCTVSVALGAAPQDPSPEPEPAPISTFLDTVFLGFPATPTKTQEPRLTGTLVLEVDLATNVARVVPPSNLVSVTMELEHPEFLGRFLYGCADAGLTLESLRLLPSEAGKRSVVFKVTPDDGRSAIKIAVEVRAAAMAARDKLIVRPRLTDDRKSITLDLLEPPSSTGHRIVVDPPVKVIQKELAPGEPKIDGVVLEVRHKSGDVMVLLDCGTNASVQEGTEFDVYSGGTYKGHLRVFKVNAVSCAAILQVQIAGQDPEAGDRVTTHL